MRYVIPVLFLGLAACQPVTDNPPIDAGFDGGGAFAQNPSVAGSGTRYDCDTGETVFAEVRGRQALISLDDGRNLALPRVDGNRYAGDGWVWFVSGSDAVLTEQGGQRNCRTAQGGF